MYLDLGGDYIHLQCSILIGWLVVYIILQQALLFIFNISLQIVFQIVT